MFTWLKSLFTQYNSKRKLSLDDEFNLNKKNKQDKTNYILDKISEKGYSYLTKKEIDFLNKNTK